MDNFVDNSIKANDIDWGLNMQQMVMDKFKKYTNYNVIELDKNDKYSSYDMLLVSDNGNKCYCEIKARRIDRYKYNDVMIPLQKVMWGLTHNDGLKLITVFAAGEMYSTNLRTVIPYKIEIINRLDGRARQDTTNPLYRLHCFYKLSDCTEMLMDKGDKK